MANNNKLKNSLLMAPLRRGGPAFRHLRRHRWLQTISVFFLLLPIALYLSIRFQTDLFTLTLTVGWFIAVFTITLCGNFFVTRERADFIDCTLEAPQEKDLLTYIMAFAHDNDKMKAQSAPIISELLGRLSVEQLAAIPDYYWRVLCPFPKDTPSGYSDAAKVDLYDLVSATTFSAIMRMKRMDFLPEIKRWRQHLKRERHSEDFLCALHKCHETLMKYQAGCDPSTTLLRPSSAENRTSDVLLRPFMETHLPEIETGEQLLRSWQGAEKGFADRPDAAVSCASFELTRGDRTAFRTGTGVRVEVESLD